MIDQGRTSNVVNIHYEKEELEGEILLGSCWGGHQALGKSLCNVLCLVLLKSSKTWPGS